MQDKQLGFVFPGQGSQKLGMLDAMYQQSGIVRQVFDQASSVLDIDLWLILSQGPQQQLDDTEITQPIVFCAGIAMWQIWLDNNGATPSYVAGHSLGEYTALVSAESLAFDDAVKLLSLRGQLMKQAVPTGVGSMAAILGLEDQQIVDICAAQSSSDASVSAANFNSPGQVVIAGHSQAVIAAIDAAKQAGAKKAITLAVSVPSHCTLMQSAADGLAETLNSVSLQTAQIPIINNVDAIGQTDPDKIKDALVRQLIKPVRWVETIQKLKSSGVETMIECGPGKVLSGLNRRIERRMPISPIFDPESLQKALQSMQGNN